MLILPIGQEHGEVRRQPWVSYAIIGLNVVVFAFLWAASIRSDVPARFEEKAREVAEYLVRNPYLTVPPELVPFYGRRALQLLEPARRATTPPVDWVVRRQQQKLNAMAKELFAIGRELPLLAHGFVPADPDPFAALSSLFVHAGLFHLVGNLLFFFATGPFLEDVYGRPLFLLLYLSCGAAALVAHTWQSPGSLAPVVGASGAVAGIMGAFLVRLRTSRIRFLFFPIVNYTEGDHGTVREMLTDAGTLLGLSDGGAHCGAIVDASVPSFMLTHWGRDRSRGPGLPLEQLVKMQTSETADFFGLSDRGRLAPGLRADVNLIDFDALRLHKPELVHDMPANGRRFVQKVDGYRATICAGTPIFERGEHTGALPGKLVRDGQIGSATQVAAE